MENFREDFLKLIQNAGLDDKAERNNYKNMKIMSYTKAENKSTMKLRFKVLPDWVDVLGNMHLGSLVGLIDSSSVAISHLVDVRESSSLSLETLFRGQAGVGELLDFDCTLEKFGTHYLTIKTIVRCNERMIAMNTHTKFFMAGTNWREKI